MLENCQLTRNEKLERATGLGLCDWHSTQQLNDRLTVAGRGTYIHQQRSCGYSFSVSRMQANQQMSIHGSIRVKMFEQTIDRNRLIRLHRCEQKTIFTLIHHGEDVRCEAEVDAR